MTEAADASDTSCSPERPPNITPIRRDTMDRYSSRRRFEIARGLRGDEMNRHGAWLGQKHQPHPRGQPARVSSAGGIDLLLPIPDWLSLVAATLAPGPRGDTGKPSAEQDQCAGLGDGGNSARDHKHRGFSFGVRPRVRALVELAVVARDSVV